MLAAWAPVNGRLRIEYLGVVFQIYPREFPNLVNAQDLRGDTAQKGKRGWLTRFADIIMMGTAMPKAKMHCHSSLQRSCFQRTKKITVRDKILFKVPRLQIWQKTDYNKQ